MPTRIDRLSDGCTPTQSRTPRAAAGTGAAAIAFAVCSVAHASKPPPAEILIDDTNVYAESMSATSNGTVYFGSIKGIVFRALPGGARAEPWIRPTQQAGPLAIFGVLADERSRTLWLCSSPTTLINPPAVGTTSLMAFDLQSGALKGSYPFPAPASLCNDITIARDGTAYVSDTINGRILKLPHGGKNLEPFAADARLKGIDGLVLSGDGVLYVNIVTNGKLMRVDRNRDGSAGTITELATSQPLGAPDGFRLIRKRTFLLAEGSGGRMDEVTIDGDSAAIKVLREGLSSPPAVTHFGKTAYVLEGKIRYLIDPKLKGQDPGAFKAYAVPLPDSR